MLVLATRKKTKFCVFCHCAPNKIWSFNQTSFFTGSNGGAQKPKIDTSFLDWYRLEMMNRELGKSKQNVAQKTRSSLRSKDTRPLFDSQTTEQEFHSFKHFYWFPLSSFEWNSTCAHLHIKSLFALSYCKDPFCIKCQ